MLRIVRNRHDLKLTSEVYTAYDKKLSEGGVGASSINHRTKNVFIPERQTNTVIPQSNFTSPVHLKLEYLAEWKPHTERTLGQSR